MPAELSWSSCLGCPPAALAMPQRTDQQIQLQRWQNSRTWARLIREAEALWHVDVRDLRRLGALELGQLVAEVPPRLRPQVNRWLACYRVSTRLD